MTTSLRVESWLDVGEELGTSSIAAQAKRLEELGFDRAYTAATRSCPWCLPPIGLNAWS